MAISSVILQGDCLTILPTLDAGSVHCCVTSPPYWGLRDYGVSGQLGLEATPDEYVARMVAVFREVRRVLRDDGTLWLNLGDSYATQSPIRKRNQVDQSYGTRHKDHPLTPKPQDIGLKTKDLVGIPWRVAFALQADGWYLRQDIIWHKPSPMPESVTDRCTKAHEYIFLLTKSPRYYYDANAIREESAPSSIERSHLKRTSSSSKHAATSAAEQRCVNMDAGQYGNGRNKRSVWTVPTQPYRAAHFATFPEKLIEPCILAGCPEGGTVLDPFAGSGTTGVVAQQFGRAFVGVELSPEYCRMAEDRIAKSMRPATARSGGGKPAPLFSTGVPTGAAE